jgi:ribosomal protein S4E
MPADWHKGGEQTVMPNKTINNSKLKDGAHCTVIGGTHKGKAGTVRDINTSKSGNVTITVVQANGERFKTLAKNVVVA